MYEAEAEALFARMTVQPAEWRKGVINTAIASLKAGGVWSRLSALYVFAAANKQAAYLNWVQNQTITESVDPVTHVADRYSEGLLTGDTDFLQTPNGIDSKFTETDAHYGVQINFVREFQRPVGSFGTFDASILDDNSSNGMRGRMHNGAYYTWGGLDAAHYMLSQSGGALTPYKNGTASSSPITQTAPSPNGTFRLLRGDGFGTPPNYQIRAFHLGQSLTSAQVTTLHNALQTYFTQLAAGEPIFGSAVCESTAVASEAGASVHYRGAGTFYNSGSGGSVLLPSGLQNQDLLLLAIETANQSISVTSPAGWQEVTGSPLGTGTAAATDSTRLTVFWKRHATGDAAPVITDSGDHQAARVFAFRNVQPSGTPWNAVASDVLATQLTEIVIPGLTTSAQDALIVDIVAHGRDVSTASVSSHENASVVGLQEISDNTTIVGNGGGFAVALSRKITPGAVNATTAVLAGPSRQGRMKIALVKDSSGQQDLAGSLANVASVVGALTVAKPLAGTALSDVGSAIAPLSVAKPLAGTGLSDVGSAIAPLSVAKPVAGTASTIVAASADVSVAGSQSLGGSAVTVAAASAALNKVAGLAGTALSDVGSVIAPLSVAKPVGGAASNVASASAGLSVSGTLSGVALVIATAASAGLSKTATLAGTGATLASASADLTVSGTLSGVALVIATAASAGLSTTATLAGSALSDVQPVVAPLSVAKPLGGTLAALSTATADLLATGSMSGAALSVVAATGALSKTAPIAGLADGLTSASATPTVAKPLAAPALVEAQAAAALGKVAALAGSASGLSSAVASFAGDASVSGSAAGLASASASLAKTAALAGAALTVASAGATMAGEAALAAEGLSTASAQATLSKESLLAAVAVVDVASTGDLSAQGVLGLSGDASVVSSGSASLSVLKALEGPAQVIAAASASVTTTSLGPTGRIVMTIKPVTLLMEATAETLARPGIRRINQVA